MVSKINRKYKKKWLLMVALCGLLIGNAFAQNKIVSGTIYDSKGETIPFVSVMIAGTSKGVSANSDGNYRIASSEHKLVLTFSAIGYKTSVDTITLSKSTIFNKVLQVESYQLKDVVVKVNAEDPAYAMIREAIKKRKEHLNEISAYRVKTYVKGLQKLVSSPKKIFGRDLRQTLALDSIGSGILYLSESQSNFSWAKPNRIKEEMISSKVSGRNNAFSFNRAADMSINFYENIVLGENELSSRGFISPVADNALFYYRYKWLGTSEENGLVINKIQVYPKRKNDPVFSGTIYLVDDSWRLSGVNLYLTAESGIQFVDSIGISQSFTKVGAFLLPNMTRFDFTGGIFSFKFKGYFMGFFSDYEVNPQFPAHYFTNEVLKINKTVNTKDSIYWAEARPLPLTLEEKSDYHKKDSLSVIRSSKKYLDSVSKKNNQFTWAALLRGYTNYNRYRKQRFIFDALIPSLFYNTVEGGGFKYGIVYQKTFEDKRNFQVRPEVRYGFSSKTLTANLKFDYVYAPLKRASWGLNFGSDIQDLNSEGTMPLFANTLNTLLYERNYPKFYRRDFVKLSSQRELASGFQAGVSVTVAQNTALVNHNSYTIRDFVSRIFTSNNPFSPSLDVPLFATHRSTELSLFLRYKFGQKYISTPNSKMYVDSKYPQLILNYRKGLKPIFGSVSDFDFVSLELSQEKIALGMLGFSSFTFGGGVFLNNRTVNYPAFKHFRGNNSLLFKPDLRNFGFLDFYRFSTDKHYVEGHFEHNFAGFVLNKIPLIRKLKLSEFVGVNYLNEATEHTYTELYFGFRHLVFGLSYGYAFERNRRVAQGFRYTYQF